MKRLLIILLVTVSSLYCSEPRREIVQTVQEKASATKEVLEHQQKELETAFKEREGKLEEEQKRQEELNNKEEVARLESELKALNEQRESAQVKLSGNIKSLDEVIAGRETDVQEAEKIIENAMALTSELAVQLSHEFVAARKEIKEAQQAVQAMSLYKPVRDWVEKFWKENVSLTWAELVGNKGRVETLKRRIAELEQSLNNVSEGRGNLDALSQSMGQNIADFDRAIAANNNLAAQQAAQDVIIDVVLVDTEIENTIQEPEKVALLQQSVQNALAQFAVEFRRLTYYEWLDIPNESPQEQVIDAVIKRQGEIKMGTIDWYHLEQAQEYLLDEAKKKYDADMKKIGVLVKIPLPPVEEQSAGDILGGL